MNMIHTIGLSVSVLTLAIGTAMAAHSDVGAALAAAAKAGTPTHTPSYHVSQHQLDRLNEKVALAQRIADNVAGDAEAKGATAGWRENLLTALYMTSSEALRRMATTVHTLDDAHAAATVASVNVKGSGRADCRQSGCAGRRSGRSRLHAHDALPVH